MENDKLEKSTEEPRWKDVVNIDEILSKIGPEGCHELAKKLVEVADEDVQNALEQEENERVKESLNKIEWFETSGDNEPFLNTAVVVELDNEKLSIGQLDENYHRKCWMIQGSGKMFWRSMFERVEKWRWMTPDEMVEYHVNRTLKIIEDDKES